MPGSRRPEAPPQFNPLNTSRIATALCSLPAGHWDKEETKPQSLASESSQSRGRMAWLQTRWCRSARLSPCPQDLPHAGPSIRGKPNGGTSTCSFRPLSQATPSAQLPLTAFPQNTVSQWDVGPGREGGRAGRGRRIQRQGSRSSAQGSRPAVARPVGLRHRLCVNGPCPPPSLCIHSPASPLAWIIPATIQLPIKTNFPLIIEKRKIKAKAPEHRWFCSASLTARSALVVTTLPTQEASPPLPHRHCRAPTASIPPAHAIHRTPPRPGHRADSGGRRGEGGMDGTEKDPDPTHKSTVCHRKEVNRSTDNKRSRFLYTSLAWEFKGRRYYFRLEEKEGMHQDRL